jgi:hypothetical protein
VADNIWWWHSEPSSGGPLVTGTLLADLGSRPQPTVYAFGAIQRLRYVSASDTAPFLAAKAYVDSYTVNGVPVSGFVPAPAIWAHDVDTITFAWELNPERGAYGDIWFTFQVFGFG